MKILSLIYLVLGTLGFIGFLAHFNQWPAPAAYLFILALPYYLATLTLTILIHPLACFVIAAIKVKRKESGMNPLIHGVWSCIISASFMTMVFNGYIISA
jgi:hypothetical protein